MWLVKCLKSLVAEHLSTVSMLNGLKKCTKALPSYSFITFAKSKLENVSVSVSEIVGVFINTRITDEQ